MVTTQKLQNQATYGSSIGGVIQQLLQVAQLMNAPNVVGNLVAGGTGAIARGAGVLSDAPIGSFPTKDIGNAVAKLGPYAEGVKKGLAKAGEMQATEAISAGIPPEHIESQAGLKQNDLGSMGSINPQSTSNNMTPAIANINPKTPFDGPMGSLKAIFPFPLAMPDLMSQKWQQGFATTPQGKLDLAKAEAEQVPLSLATKQQLEKQVELSPTTQAQKKAMSGEPMTDAQEKLAGIKSTTPERWTPEQWQTIAEVMDRDSSWFEKLLGGGKNSAVTRLYKKNPRFKALFDQVVFKEMAGIVPTTQPGVSSATSRKVGDVVTHRGIKKTVKAINKDGTLVIGD